MSQGAGTEPALFDLGMAAPRDRIYFQEYRQLEKGDFEVGEGIRQELAACERSLAAEERTALPPGIYVELAEQGGSPSLVFTIYLFVPPNGAPVVLSGTYCTSFSYSLLQEHIFVKKKHSWFRTKTKISIVRNELRIDSANCFDL